MNEAFVGKAIIRPINKAVVHRICAGQVILDLSVAVKELVENSLDAGATSVEVALKDFGEEWFQVIDNGSGISPDNFKVLALKHHTSKLADFSDLQSLTTFGFRGEALSSLCGLGDLTVETRTSHEPVATHLTYDRSGLLIKEKQTARQIGTTVTVSRLFSNLPVRSKEFKRNIRKEYGKLLSLLNAYAIISKGVRFVCTNTTGKNTRSVVLKTQGSDSLKDNIITVLGISTFNCLEQVSMEVSDGCKVDGFLSKPGQGSGRNLGDRQYYFANGRPVDLPKVSKIVNELYKGANSKQYPIAILNFTVPTRSCDVNVTPDKRKVFFSEENSIMVALRSGMQRLYSSSNATFSVNSFSQNEENEDGSHFKMVPFERPSATDGSKYNLIQGDDDAMVRKAESLMKDYCFHSSEGKLLKISHKRKVSVIENCGIDDCKPVNPVAYRPSGSLSNSFDGKPLNPTQSTMSKFVTVNKRKFTDEEKPISEFPMLRNKCLPLLKRHNAERHIGEELDFHDSEKRNPNHLEVAFVKPNENFEESCCDEPAGKEIVSLSDKSSSRDCLANVAVPSSSLRDSNPLLDTPLISHDKSYFSFKFSFYELKSRRFQRRSRLSLMKQDRAKSLRHKAYVDASVEISQPNDNDRKAKALALAESELERLFQKGDFNRMKVIGQFNLGFIVGKVEDDLFIVDQHAADEKYNFERFCRTTIMNQQPLLRPLVLELSPEEEVIASLNMNTIRKNGFTLEEDVEAPPGLRYKLKSVPFSKNITFGAEDVKDLISSLADEQGECSLMGSYKGDTLDSVCPTRVRSMLASRACRSSVMIGDSLGRTDMLKIIQHLAELNSPWNCPHGRPTMRHLIDLSSLRRPQEDDNEDAI